MMETRKGDEPRSADNPLLKLLDRVNKKYMTAEAIGGRSRKISQSTRPIVQRPPAHTQRISSLYLDLNHMAAVGLRAAPWQLSLLHAIESASHLPAPPDPSVFAKVLTVEMGSQSFASASSGEGFEPPPVGIVDRGDRSTGTLGR